MPAAFLMQQMEWREALDDAARRRRSRGAGRRRWPRTTQALLARLRQPLDEQRDCAAAAQQVRALMFVERFRAGHRAPPRSAGRQAETDHGPAADLRTRPVARPAPAPHRRGHRPGHHPFAGGRGAPRRGRVPARRAGPRDPALGRALPATAAGARSASRRWPRRPTTRENTIVSVKRFMGRGLADIAADAQAALPLRRPARHGGAATRATA